MKHTHAMLALLLSACGVARAEGDFIRPAAVAGMFYEREPAALERQVSGLLQRAPAAKVPGPLVAAVVPHAGYVYSGPCAASVYALVASGRYDRVIILCPAHRAAVAGVAPPARTCTGYATPLGVVPLDRAAGDGLRGKPGFVDAPGADADEHAIEVHLPFLQRTAGRFALVPLLCGPPEAVDVGAVAAALAPLLDDRTLLLASSDFTHYGSHYRFRPFTERVPERLREWLTGAAGRVADRDLAGFERHCRETRDSICGETPIRIVLATLAARGQPVTGQVLSTALSGDLSGDYANSVSYAAIGFFAGSAATPLAAADAGRAGTPLPAVRKEDRHVKEQRSGQWSPGLTAAEQATVFAIARDTLKWCVEGGRGRFDFSPYTLTPRLRQDMATFVTLKIGGHLRGCIGSLAPVAPLYESVQDNAVNAALRDPRFMPVQPDELARIEVDVSILSPIRDIASVAEFKLGQMGIILEKGRHRAVYLPEVAIEQGWTVEETLSSLSQKAGLAPDAWREGAKFKVFESVVLSE